MSVELQTTGHAPVTITAFVLNSLRNDILSGRFPLGTRLDQQAISKELGVSIIPVRESLRQLEAEKLVVIYPRKGAFVVELSIKDLEEIYLLRETLEALAITLAVTNLSAELFQELAEILIQLEMATNRQDIDRVLDLSRAFYFVIYTAAQRPLLVQILASLWDRSTFYRRMYLYLPDRMSQALAGHKEIYQICQKGEKEAAGKLIQANVHRTLVGILSKIQADRAISLASKNV